jgi:predicted RNA-binding protein with RPS1 domain
MTTPPRPPLRSRALSSPRASRSRGRSPASSATASSFRSTAPRAARAAALIPTAETATPRGADLHKAFPIDAEVEAKIVKIEEDGKIRLSISALKVDEERSQFESFAKDARSQGQNGALQNPKEPPPKKVGTLGLLLQKNLQKQNERKK